MAVVGIHIFSTEKRAVLKQLPFPFNKAVGPYAVRENKGLLVKAEFLVKINSFQWQYHYQQADDHHSNQELNNYLINRKALLYE
jgi:hypothetical protein